MTELSAEARAVLAHVVADPEAWWAHVRATMPIEKAAAALIDKLRRWRPAYEAAKDTPGYLTRLERDLLDPDARAVLRGMQRAGKMLAGADLDALAAAAQAKRAG